MNRIDITLKDAQKAGRTLLSPYITAGDPVNGDTVALMHALVEKGADILELGIPFSDPMAEGPVIQAAMERALAAKTTCETVLDCVRLFRTKDCTTPVILMGYVNPIEQYGYARFARDAAAAGVDGTIIVDLPPEESADVSPLWDASGLSAIYLCSPTTSAARMQALTKFARSYLYLVSLKGVTGSDSLNMQVLESTWRLRKSQTTLPLFAGFGIKTPELAAQVGAFADGVVVGAALIACLEQAHHTGNNPIPAGAALIGAMRDAMNKHGKNHAGNH
ncbi:tryptophan synthase subunit alpha [Legionella geestiana]|uniref:Tryptophan synthase alpha chain n=1 Tax=Legionella geestiana TaxID=45065 RepID=A0A0W0TYN6_9GAMM|nr:tryptophan synthase subunit alpha [Legionella geestiana]KTD00730.1 tryptophan synthase subunit alpha [Legionella geestiana]QBS11589.1 tryptophan synthase subunit alpha [Legionella geestiana]QDQ40802.1 tryptophan synthase subunit alpha [Legionella geestiana]STX53735.1 tryptophan synthase subunit alpha [Legionella geestiana]